MPALFLTVVLFILTVFGYPQNVIPRNESEPATITLNLDVAFVNGSRTGNKTILSSSFRTLLYIPPHLAEVSSLTGRDLQPRLMYRCRSPTATFQHSHCIHRPGEPGAMQRYIIYCREQFQENLPHPHALRPMGEIGMCSNKEICVDSWIGDQYDGITLARCVPQDAFEPMDSTDDDMDGTNSGGRQGQDGRPPPMDRFDDSEEDDSGHIGGEKRRKLDRGFVLGGNQASAVISQTDRLTPMGIEKLELDAVGNAQNTKTCRNCFQLNTKKMAVDTTQLNMEATLAAAGTGIAAGVMWVALFSG